MAKWSLGVGIVATIAANLAHGIGHGVVGALVSAWPAVALVGSYELLMVLIKAGRGTSGVSAVNQGVQTVEHGTSSALLDAPPLEQAIRARYRSGASQRAIARDFKIDRRKVKRIIEQPE